MFKKIYTIWKHQRFQSYLRKEELKLLPIRKKFYSQFIKAGDLVFDVGANVGNRSKVFLDMGAKVVAIEPQPYCINQLRKRFGAALTIVDKGLGAENGKAFLNVADVANISSLSEKFIKETGRTRFSSNKWDKKVEIQLTTMDELISVYGLPVFCKIDVEGYEPEVLKGLHQSIPFLSFEYCVPEMNEELLSTLKIMFSINPSVKFNYSTGETMELAMSEWTDYYSFLKIVEDKEFEKTLFGDIYCKN